ncbi:DUF2726 domain-containing protein [Paucibacter sp. R3-3]|uniref:DUF2726 domain-containing protein n=1 Tax=Roseateles agri TaxID=3098619 RepID=A0ABU5DBN2_9BURK|nr:DUF2726 domain-containing protein [Paucibacter sp. R3-3]MDY0743133.1 DUF2726 domain-containing protein [Paucibacter sp. R3-3]
MPDSALPWIIASLCGLAAVLVAAWAFLRKPAAAAKPLPIEWSLTARPVFSSDERRVYRQLREALPHHVILAKLPLVRFCQPVEAKEVRYWFELLGAIHVSFAICSPNGRVLAAVDLESERSSASRSLMIKQSVLGACRVRYLRCRPDQLPSAAELQLLVPYSNTRGPQAAPTPGADRSGPNSRPGALHGQPLRRSAQDSVRGSLWQDSAFFNDSFFAPDSRFDNTAMDSSRTGRHNYPSSRFADSSFAGEPLNPQQSPHYPDEAPNDIVGVVVDSPRYGGGHTPR